MGVSVLGGMRLSMAVEGFVLNLAAEGRSVHTIADYRVGLRKLVGFLGDMEVEEIAGDDVRRFLVELRGQVGPKTVQNMHATLSSFWSWAVASHYASEQVMRAIDRPRAPAPVIQPFREEQMKALLRGCDRSARWVARRSGKETSTRRLTGLRDRALLLFLLDTGVRASELCGLTMEHVVLASGQARVMGKGQKERLVYFGKRTRQVLWRYLATRLDTGPEAPCFATVLNGEHPLTRDVLYRLLARMGERVQVAEVYPHRFRHTFAITYLRNGGDIFTLQRLLGHSSLDMVRRYAAIADCDAERVHERASPVDNWRL